MKTTKDIAELFSQEIERISKGEIRKDVIEGLEKCSNAMISLARLEMDYAWKEWETIRPNVPWLSSHTESKLKSPPTPEPKPVVKKNVESKPEKTRREQIDRKSVV